MYDLTLNSFIESNNWNHTPTKPLTITRHWDGEYNLAKSCILLQYANQIWVWIGSTDQEYE